jgi:uracil-DNA glycosylase
MLNFTREDVLRELELLPVWQLRAPVKPEVSISQAPISEAPAVAIEAETMPAIAEATLYLCTTSDDKRWAFVWPASLVLSASECALFSNILVALKITKSTQMQVKSVENIEASVIIVMGEVSAQQILNTKESIETLRSKTHQLENTTLIVTYHPNDMLQNLQLKAKTWEDLCLARRILSA